MEKILLNKTRRILMAKRVNNYFNQKHKNNFFDINTDELMSLIEAGYKTEEISKALNVSKEEVNRLRNEVNKY